MADPSPTAAALTTPCLPDPAETLAADFPDWYVFRDLLEGPGHWRVIRGDQTVSAPTIARLRELLEAEEGER